jgi:UDP-glucose 4-epimerase
MEDPAGEKSSGVGGVGALGQHYCESLVLTVIDSSDLNDPLEVAVAGDSRMNGRTVLVTGGAGFIGSHVTLALLDQRCRVVVIDNLSTGFRAAVPEAATFVHANVGDSETVRKVISKHSVEAIMHFAGSLSVPESVTDPVKYFRNNTVQSESLIEDAIDCGVENFVFSSTCAVYGIPERLPITEDSDTLPINPYGASKLMTERMLSDCATAGLLKACRLRYFNVAGADPYLRAGQRTVGSSQLIKAAVETVLGKRECVTVHGTDFPTPDGTGVRDYIHVSDLANAHVLALRKLMDDPERDLLFNCGYGHGFSVLEVLDAVDRISGKPSERRFGEARPGDPPTLVSSNERITQLLGWVPQFDDLETIVSHSLAWERHLQ